MMRESIEKESFDFIRGHLRFDLRKSAFKKGERNEEE